MGSDLTGEGDRERETERSRDEKVGRKGFGLTIVVGHDSTEISSSFHTCPSTGYVQFSIRGAVGAYSVHLGISCSGTSTIGIYSTDGIYSTGGIYSIDS
ncbi:hypothetical protein COCNU_03G000410 [Cocos nucifera]|uniref:Uncharacterized protein n=1 Tax=Cocos nucifera TaxID=13894 RepID=A0A8K0I135_COCNU|nr:hypothetical protein COCNU_03G000410 [Cocos nucifera]